MNLDSYNYYSLALVFADVMKSAGEMMTYNATGSSPWNTEKNNEIPKDPQGYPLEIPAKVVGAPPQAVRFLINDNYKGRYVLTYDGEGEFDFGVNHSENLGKTIIELDGKGEHRWINITKSKKGNHIRNIRILPEDEAYDPNSPFNPLFIEGLKPFHCLRFMDFMMINNSPLTTWASRAQPDYYSQGTEKGIAIEYAVQLCNQLQCDGWFCVPAKADDDYIRNYAQLVRNTLNPNLKVYLEYSNEIWNWQFQQSGYVLENAPGAKDSYVSEALKAISPSADTHPEKDAYMIQRTFKIWSEVFGEEHKHRLVRVATVQHAWVDNTRRILEYLFKYDQKKNPKTEKVYKDSLGAGCDAVSPAGYFGFSDQTRDRWLTMDPEKITQDVVFNAIEKDMQNREMQWTLETAKYARAWNLDYFTYEGGQHLLVLEQKQSPYNEPIWDAQINPRMYDMYMKLFATHVLPEVNCKLFMAYSYVSPRKTLWGSWGHLENLEQLTDIHNIKTVAPKYDALLEANTSK